MQTPRENLLILLQAALDLLALCAAWYLTVYFRILINPIMDLRLEESQIVDAAPPLSSILVLWLLAAVWLKVYRPNGDKSRGTALLRTLESVAAVSTITIVIIFFSRELGADLSRSFVLLFVPLSCTTLLTARYTGLLTDLLLKKKWPLQERVAVVGQGRKARAVVDQIRSAAGGCVKVAGVILPPEASTEGLGNPIPILGFTPQLAELVNRHHLAKVIFADDPAVDVVFQECSAVLRRMNVISGRDLGAAKSDSRLTFINLYGLDLLEFRPVPFTRRQEIVKWLFDRTVSAGLLLVLLPLLVVVAILIKLTSKGPAIYTSYRVGKGGRHFAFLKFRSMREGADLERGKFASSNEKNGKIFKIRDDPRVTTIGRFIRRYSIDELPQLWNVLKGDMSLVGPRPLPAADLDPDGQSRDFALWAEQRSLVVPGITGFWQIRGRSDLPFEKMVALDLKYIQNWSLALDLRILLETPLVVLTGRGAY